MAQPATVPCQYKTGRTLGHGTYAVVKEAVHIETGKLFACKVINKKMMQGREQMVRNEIMVLRTISKGHSNILTLEDYFETANNLYLVTELCTGGELFDRICAKGSYYERDACHLVRVIVSAVSYLHDQGIVHRDLKPENLLFKGPSDDSELLIADFGLSKMIDDSKLGVLTTTCGTPGYMAPEIFMKQGHGKPVDLWAIGVITYFLLSGYTPFDRDNNVEEIQAICKADYAFEPREYWQNVSDLARHFIQRCLTIDPKRRLTATEALQHPWLASDLTSQGVPDPASPSGEMKDLLPNVRRNFDAKKTFRKAILAVRFTNQTRHSVSTEDKAIMEGVEQAKRDAEAEHIDSQHHVMAQ